MTDPKRLPAATDSRADCGTGTPSSSILGESASMRAVGAA